MAVFTVSSRSATVGAAAGAADCAAAGGGVGAAPRAAGGLLPAAGGAPWQATTSALSARRPKSRRMGYLPLGADRRSGEDDGAKQCRGRLVVPGTRAIAATSAGTWAGCA